MSNWPDSPEGVALALMDRILEQEENERRNTRRSRADMLALFRECVAAVNSRGGDDRPGWLN
jgi:hypothetical protein